MKFANVFETKAKLSQYLKIVNNGEDVIVTCRGKPYAVIKKLTEEDLDIASSSRFLKLAEPSFAKVWDNEEDSVYDKL